VTKVVLGKELKKTCNKALLSGDGLGKTKANALSVSPTVSPEQLSELILKTNPSVQMNGERVNETGSLLSDPISSSRNTGNTLEHSINNGSNNSAQDDMFSMPDNIEQETLIPEPSVDAVVTDETNVAAETKTKIQTLHTKDREEYTEQHQESVESVSTVEIGELQELAHQQLVEKKSTTPLLDNFYQQLIELIEIQPEKIIDKTVIDSYFPEFELIGKTALGKWLKELVEQEKLIKTKSRKPQYTLPKQS